MKNIVFLIHFYTFLNIYSITTFKNAHKCMFACENSNTEVKTGCEIVTNIIVTKPKQ